MTESEARLREVEARLRATERMLKEATDAIAKVAQQQRLSSPGTAGGGNGNSPLIRGWLPTGIAAGTFGTPASKSDGIIAVRSGSGWTISGGITGQTVYNCDTTAVTGAKSAWFIRRPDNSLELVLADC